MKKLFILLAVVGAAFFTSCDNENTVNPQPTGKATITGIVYYNFDLTNDDPNVTKDKVANRKYIVTITNDEKSSFQEGTTDANGNYSVEVTVGNDPIDEVTIELVDFRQSVKTASDKTEEKDITGLSTSVENVVKGGEYIRDINK
jgi:hypothetical protein